MTQWVRHEIGSRTSMHILLSSIILLSWHVEVASFICERSWLSPIS